MAGSLSGGKLGLGKGQKRGYQLNFRVIPRSDLPEVEYIACGLDHMLAITKANTNEGAGGQKAGNSGNGRTFAWGRNSRGQLGIGSKENQYSPRMVNTNERFKKVVCGHNYSLAITYGNQVFFWGNLKYCCDPSARKDIEDPTPLPDLDMYDIQDVECCYKQCYLILKKGALRQWGKFLASK